MAEEVSVPTVAATWLTGLMFSAQTDSGWKLINCLLISVFVSSFLNFPDPSCIGYWSEQTIKFLIAAEESSLVSTMISRSGGT